MKTLNPANPANNGALPKEKLYTQDEVDALIEAAKTKMTLLWTNPNSSSAAFSAQTISLDLSGYDLVYFLVRVYVNDSNVVSKTFTSTCPVGIGQHLLSCNSYYDTGVNGVRQVGVSTTGISVSSGKLWNPYGNQRDNNNYCAIPYKIYGIKL
jgi:hypothetical protein